MRFRRIDLPGVGTLRMFTTRPERVAGGDGLSRLPDMLAEAC